MQLPPITETMPTVLFTAGEQTASGVVPKIPRANAVAAAIRNINVTRGPAAQFFPGHIKFDEKRRIERARSAAKRVGPPITVREAH